MPRIRYWKDLTLYRPSSQDRYTHIDTLFREQVDWELIQTMLPDMLRVALSIRAGKIRPSIILRRLATYSCKNKLYFAFRELGRVVRTIFLLRYISSVEMRHVIQAATNKSEAFNLSVDWVCRLGQLWRSGLARRKGLATSNASSSNTIIWWRTCWRFTQWST